MAAFFLRCIGQMSGDVKGECWDTGWEVIMVNIVLRRKKNRKWAKIKILRTLHMFKNLLAVI